MTKLINKMKKHNLTKIPKRLNNHKFILLIIVFLVIVMSARYYHKIRQFIFNIAQQPIPSVQIITPDGSVTNITPITPKSDKFIESPPDFSNEPTKPKYRFDTQSWKTFDDQRIGVRLKYPSEWTQPKVEYSESTCPESSQDCMITGSVFHASFPNSTFVFGGASADFSAPRGASFIDFNGFGSNNKHYYFADSAEALCRRFDDSVFCLEQNGQIHLLPSAICDARTEGFGSYKRIMFIDRPGQKISGLAFGGSFLAEDYFSYRNKWELCINHDEKKPNEEITRIFDSAILERKLDSESMRNYDLFEKVFQTVEVY